MKKLSLSIVLTMISAISAFAQSEQVYQVEMATGLRSSGKIWVVVGVLLTLIIGLFIFLFTIDRRVKKLENK